MYVKENCVMLIFNALPWKSAFKIILHPWLNKPIIGAGKKYVTHSFNKYNPSVCVYVFLSLYI